MKETWHEEYLTLNVVGVAVLSTLHKHSIKKLANDTVIGLPHLGFPRVQHPHLQSSTLTSAKGKGTLEGPRTLFLGLKHVVVLK